MAGIRVKSLGLSREQVEKANRLFCMRKNINEVAEALGMAYETLQAALKASKKRHVRQIVDDEVIAEAYRLEGISMPIAD
jgi:hypothetical protein